MKLAKAIEISNIHCKLNLVDKNPDLKAAILLVIEAAKRVKQERTGYETYAPDLLPGEDF